MLAVEPHLQAHQQEDGIWRRSHSFDWGGRCSIVATLARRGVISYR